jgi:hypothetical protein
MTEQTHSDHPPTDRRKMSLLKIVSFTALALGTLVLVCGLTFLLFLGPIVNRFVKPKITAAFVGAYPAYVMRIADMRYNIRDNSFRFDSVALSAADSSFTGTMGTLSVSGIRWLHLLWGGSLATPDFDSAAVDAQEIALTFPQSTYELRCGRLRASIADSELVASALELHPGVDDAGFFGVSKFRTTRFNVATQYCQLTGVAFLDAVIRKNYHARSIHVRDISLDILINKDKPAMKDSSTPSMPGESLSSMKGGIHCDSIDIINGSLKYSERFVLGSEPAVITFDSLDVLAEGIATHTDHNAALVIHAKGKFMKSATMNLRMSFPVPSPEFSFHYSGSVSSMELSVLNGFLETAEQKRIKSGFLHEATFEIDVVSGRASGNVRAVYKDLTLAAINKKTGSENGFVDGLVSYIANTYKINGSNLPGTSGSIRVGKVKYLRQRNDPFFGFVWFALRSGLADVVGF